MRKTIQQSFWKALGALRKTVFVLWAVISVISFSQAASQSADSSLLPTLQNYLRGIQTLRADLKQVNPNGSQQSGTLILNLKTETAYGQLRIDYESSQKDWIISDGVRLAIETQGERDIWDVSQTPAALLLTKKILLKDYDPVIHIQEGCVFLTLCREGYGSVTLVFQKNPFLKLIGWTVVDTHQQKTHVKLENVVLGIPVDSHLFRWE